MPKKPKKKTKASKQEKQAARKKADEFVGVGNGEMDRALAARKKKDLATALDHLALAESAYQQALESVSTVHLDSLYNLGVCQSIRSNIYSRRRRNVESQAAHALAKQTHKVICRIQVVDPDHFFGVHFSRCTACKRAAIER